MVSGTPARILEFIDSKLDDLDSGDLFNLSSDLEAMAERAEEEEEEEEE